MISDRFPERESAYVWVPQSLSGLFDTAFELYRRHFLTLVSVTALALIPAQMIAYALVNLWLLPLVAQVGSESNDAGLIVRILLGGLLTGRPDYGVPGVLEFLALALASAPLAVTLSGLTTDRTVTLRESYSRALPALPRVLMAWLIGALAFLGTWVMSLFGCLLGIGLLYSLLRGNESDWLAFGSLFLLALIPYAIATALLAYTYVFATPILSLESVSLLALFTRQQQLVANKRFRRVWGAVFCLPQITYGLQFLILYSLKLLLDSVSGLLFLSPLVHTGLDALFAALTGLFFQTYLLIFVIVLYQDCRIRRDGLDMRVLADALPAPRADLLPARSAASSEEAA